MGRHRERDASRSYALAAVVVALLLGAVVTALVVRHAGTAGGKVSGSTGLVTPSSSAAPITSRHANNARGQNSPPGSIPGWRLVYREDFSGTSLPPRWEKYQGEPAADPYGHWDPVNDIVSG
ncbi:MAG: hypothetical protein J2P27_07680, partial [Actinobacteria bacterium]|nr:hypothetical protein [Actinomycetota bacterium]